MLLYLQNWNIFFCFQIPSTPGQASLRYHSWEQRYHKNHSSGEQRPCLWSEGRGSQDWKYSCTGVHAWQFHKDSWHSLLWYQPGKPLCIMKQTDKMYKWINWLATTVLCMFVSWEATLKDEYKFVMLQKVEIVKWVTTSQLSPAFTGWVILVCTVWHYSILQSWRTCFRIGF